MNGQALLIEVDGADDALDDGQEYLALGSPDDINIVGARLKYVDQLAKVFAVLSIDRQTEQLVMVVEARRQGRRRLGADLDQLLAIGIGGFAVVAVCEPQDELMPVYARGR